jgi:RimJ/RimL family protein N-acetyltransferase
MRNHRRVRLEPWGESDLLLLRDLMADPAMMKHLGGPEGAEKIAERQTRYEKPDSKQFRISDEASGKGVGWVGYWERDWMGEKVYEIGVSVLPALQGRGIGRLAALKAIAMARSERNRRFMHAYPSVENEPSNAMFSKLGFMLSGPCDFEYPQGSTMRSNDWRLDLFADD